MPNYRFEYNGNSDYVTLHVSVKYVEHYVSPIFQATEQELQLIKLLMSAEGIDSGSDESIYPYHFTVQVARAFDRETVLNNLLELSKVWFSVEKGITEEWVKLPTLRNDIAYRQCGGCIEEQNAEIARSMRDFETLDW